MPEPEAVEPMTWERAELWGKGCYRDGAYKTQKQLLLEVEEAIALARRERERAERAEAHAQSCSDDLAFLDKVREENEAWHMACGSDDGIRDPGDMTPDKLERMLDRMEGRLARADALAGLAQEHEDRVRSGEPCLMCSQSPHDKGCWVPDALRAYREGA